MKNFKIIGISTDKTTCDCCGKEGLNKTVKMIDLSLGVEVYFGTTCAYRTDKYDTMEAARIAKKEIQKEVRKYSKMMNDALAAAYRLLRKNGMTSPVYNENGVHIGSKANDIELLESLQMRFFENMKLHFSQRKIITL